VLHGVMFYDCRTIRHILILC